MEHVSQFVQHIQDSSHCPLCHTNLPLPHLTLPGLPGLYRCERHPPCRSPDMRKVLPVCTAGRLSASQPGP
jgi:hypothetical protein